jgi:hypothetical protein
LENRIVFRQAKIKGMDIETVGLELIRKALADYLETQDGIAQNLKGKHMYSAALHLFEAYIERAKYGESIRYE